MIDFPCKCGYAFSLPQDQAGGLIQCPQCGLLADVPKLSDLPNLNPDGTFVFEDEAPIADTTTAADLHRVFTRKTVDSQGVEKDLRPTAEYLDAVGAADPVQPRPTPRYDPVTGELIRPLQLKDEQPTPVLSIGEIVDPAEVTPEDLQPLPVESIPLATLVPQAKPQKLGYALGDTRKQVTLKTLALELLMPANTVVMFFVFILYILAHFTTSGMATYAERFFVVVWPFILLNFPMWLIVSHMGCVIEETGPHAVDELPRPLRDFSPGEDVLTPLFRTALAGILCFGPMALAFLKLNPENPATMLITLSLGIIGAFFFPAVVLTTVTGTTILNLRFDRVWAVIVLCGGNYFFSVALFIPAIIPSIYYLTGDLLFHLQFTDSFFRRINSVKVMLPVMMAAVYLLHFFCWHLGLMYRQHHDQFPWLAQRHIKQPRPDEPVVRITRQ